MTEIAVVDLITSNQVQIPVIIVYSGCILLVVMELPSEQGSETRHSTWYRRCVKFVMVAGQVKLQRCV